MGKIKTRLNTMSKVGCPEKIINNKGIAIIDNKRRWKKAQILVPGTVTSKITMTIKKDNRKAFIGTICLLKNRLAPLGLE